MPHSSRGCWAESLRSVESMKGREKPGWNFLGLYTMEGGTGYSSLQKRPLSFTWVFLVSKDRKWYPGISRAKRIPDTLTRAFYTLPGCSHWLTKLSLLTKFSKCLSQDNFINSGTASQKKIFYVYCELPSSQCQKLSKCQKLFKVSLQCSIPDQ